MADLRDAAASPFGVALAVSVLLVAGASGVLLNGSIGGSPCHDHPAAIDVYPRDFSVEMRESAVIITFEEGEPFTDVDTDELFVRIYQNGYSESENTVIATESDLPIEPGATFRLTNSSFDTLTLDSGTLVTVQMRGHERPLPWYCLNERDTQTIWEVTYDEYPIP